MYNFGKKWRWRHHFDVILWEFPSWIQSNLQLSSFLNGSNYTKVCDPLNLDTWNTGLNRGGGHAAVGTRYHLWQLVLRGGRSPKNMDLHLVQIVLSVKRAGVRMGKDSASLSQNDTKCVRINIDHSWIKLLIYHYIWWLYQQWFRSEIRYKKVNHPIILPSPLNTIASTEDNKRLEIKDPTPARVQHQGPTTQTLLKKDEDGERRRKGINQDRTGRSCCGWGWR